jgi:hypothetical protein
MLLTVLGLNLQGGAQQARLAGGLVQNQSVAADLTTVAGRALLATTVSQVMGASGDLQVPKQLSGSASQVQTTSTPDLQIPSARPQFASNIAQAQAVAGDLSARAGCDGSIGQVHAVSGALSVAKSLAGSSSQSMAAAADLKTRLTFQGALLQVQSAGPSALTIPTSNPKLEGHIVQSWSVRVLVPDIAHRGMVATGDPRAIIAVPPLPERSVAAMASSRKVVAA